MAQLVDLITQSQLRRHLGALPVLYALLEVLRVREIINGHCPTAAEVDHGTVAMVLILNRLMAPRGLYQLIVPPSHRESHSLCLVQPLRMASSGAAEDYATD